MPQRSLQFIILLVEFLLEVLHKSDILAASWLLSNPLYHILTSANACLPHSFFSLHFPQLWLAAHPKPLKISTEPSLCCIHKVQVRHQKVPSSLTATKETCLNLKLTFYRRAKKVTSQDLFMQSYIFKHKMISMKKSVCVSGAQSFLKFNEFSTRKLRNNICSWQEALNILICQSRFLVLFNFSIFHFSITL